jgi:hypothetical protein
MRRSSFVVMALACAVSLFLGCSTGNDDPNYGGEEKSLRVSVAAVPAGTAPIIKYYSLSTGLEVTEGAAIASKEWDIAFSRTRLILTNSGDTAENLSSGGQGGVWYTDKTVLGEVALGDQITPGGDFEILKDYTTDKIRYTRVDMGGPGTGTPSSLTLNVMSYVGYRNEATAAGTADDPFTSTDPENPMPYLYNKKEYYTSGSGMPPTFGNTNQVYIIRHGDGTRYSKIQITYEYVSATTGDTPTPAADVWGIRYANF